MLQQLQKKDFKRLRHLNVRLHSHWRLTTDVSISPVNAATIETNVSEQVR